jgi:GT2 family glycosyltransferase
MNIAVITIASGRHKHLERQRQGLEASTIAPDSYVVVAMNDAPLAGWTPGGAVVPLVESLDFDGARLPLAAARNLGAARALRESAELLIFLDVDCIPSPGMIEHYSAAAQREPGSLLTGAVGYLPEGTDYRDASGYDGSARFHSFRARLPAGEIASASPRYFWSLSFAVRAQTWLRIGGFSESYLGYGGEDTDFALVAQRAGVDLRWVGGAEAFHQYHPTSDPPIDHLDDILVNGKLFEQRWGSWPMEGWLREFEALGLIERKPVTGDWVRVGMEK